MHVAPVPLVDETSWLERERSVTDLQPLQLVWVREREREREVHGDQVGTDTPPRLLR